MFGSTPRTRTLKANRVYPGIADEAVEYTSDQRTEGQVNYLKGSNIAGFVKVADAMVSYGHV